MSRFGFVQCLKHLYAGLRATLTVRKIKVTLIPSHNFVWQKVVLLIHCPLASRNSTGSRFCFLAYKKSY